MQDFRSTPASALPTIELAGFDELSSRLRRLDREHVETAGRLHQLRTTGLAEAQTADRDALAAALRAATVEPKGTPETTRVEKEIALAELRQDALVEAVRVERESFLEGLESHRADWSTELASREAAARDEYASAIEALAAARQQWATAKAHSRWLTGFPSNSRLSVGIPPLQVRGMANGDPIGWQAIVDTMRAEVVPPAPPVVAPSELEQRQQTAQRRSRLAGVAAVGPGAA